MESEKRGRWGERDGEIERGREGEREREGKREGESSNKLFSRNHHSQTDMNNKHWVQVYTQTHSVVTILTNTCTLGVRGGINTHTECTYV